MTTSKIGETEVVFDVSMTAVVYLDQCRLLDDSSFGII